MAEDGMEAVAKLNAMKPDLVLLDITMPKMNGYQVCKVIKQSPFTKDLPVVMLSGNDGFFDKVKGRMAGATDYLTKPFEPAVLLKAMDKYFAKKR
jgi:twitching motility two-component system response regulator PilG